MTEQAFEAMVRQYEKLVYTVCCQLVHDHQLAEDLSQETFVSAYLHMESCPPGAEKPWLCRIAVNKAKDHLKSAYNRRMAVTEAPATPLRRWPPRRTPPAWRLSAKHAPTPALRGSASRAWRNRTARCRYCISCRNGPWRPLHGSWAACPRPCTPSFTAPKKCCGGSWRRWAERIRAQKVLSLCPGFVLY